MESFEKFWALYPRKVAKAVARKSWARMTKQQQSDALEAIPNHIAYWKLKETASEFIPHCSTFLNQERWEDELPQGFRRVTGESPQTALKRDSSAPRSGPIPAHVQSVLDRLKAKL
jgi:hypothetical protein